MPVRSARTASRSTSSDLADAIAGAQAVAGTSVAAVLRQLARSARPAARRDIALALRLSHATVSKATAHLIDLGILREDTPHAAGAGRPIVPLRWTDGYACVGVRVTERAGRPHGLVSLATGLDGRQIGHEWRRELCDDVGRDRSLLASEIAHLAKEISDECRTDRREILGLGVQAPLGTPRRELLEPLASQADCAVAVENDVTALAVRESLYAPSAPASCVIVVVADDRIGGGLILGGRPWRGRHGLAGDPGPAGAGATPQAIRAALGAGSLADAAARPRSDRSSGVFRAAGTALGRTLVPLLTWLDPERVVLYLRPELREGRPDRAGGAYVDAMRQAVGGDAELEIRYLSCPGLDLLGAAAAAALVLDRVIDRVEHHD